jgi:predicted peptidase
LIAPQCPENAKWVEVDWSASTHQQPKEPSESARLTLELIAALQKEFSIDPQRIYLTGLSMGGYGTWDLLARRPELFAAGVPVCGGADESTAPKIKNLPIWAFHGAKDQAVKVERSRNMIAALKHTGGKPKYTEYPNVGHDSWNPAYKDAEMFAWLFAQKRE